MTDAALLEPDYVPAAPPQGIAALHAMRSARRTHRLASQEWFEVAYRVYLTAFGVTIGGSNNRHEVFQNPIVFLSVKNFQCGGRIKAIDKTKMAFDQGILAFFLP